MVKDTGRRRDDDFGILRELGSVVSSLFVQKVLPLDLL